MRLRNKIRFLVSGLMFLACFSAEAGYLDYESKAQMDIENSASGVGVSKDDRFVFAADRDSNRLIVIDTWNWRVVNPLGSDTVALGGTPSDLAVSRANGYVYVSRDDGRVRRFDISGLAGLDFDNGLSSLADPVSFDTFTMSGNPLGEIAVIPQQGVDGAECLFVEDLSSGDVNWFLLDDDGIIGQGAGPLIGGQSEIELAAGNNVVFAKFVDGNPLNRIYAYQCVTGAGTIDTYNEGNNYGADTLQGLATNRSGNRLVVGDVSTQDLWLFGTSNLAAISTGPDDTYNIGFVPAALLVPQFNHDNNPIVWVAAGDSLINSPLDESLIEFQGFDYGVANYGATPFYMARSSASDEYIYVSPDGDTSMFVVTANPWVSQLAIEPAGIIDSNTVKVNFFFDMGTDFLIKTTDGFKKTGTVIKSGALTGGDKLVGRNISVDDLQEGGNIIEVNVMDSAGRTGRNAMEVQVDRAPPPLDFNLYFGDQMLIIRFTSHDLPDLAFYRIFYGTNGDVPKSAYSELDDTGQMGNPASPFRIDNPERDKEYEKVINGVTNGDTYYVQIISADETGHLSISDRLSAVPQPAVTLTDLADEDGGFACFEQIGFSHDAGRGLSLSVIIALFVPLLLMWLLRRLRRLARI